MRYHYLTGDKGQALKVYRNCAKLFDELFGEGLGRVRDRELLGHQRIGRAEANGVLLVGPVDADKGDRRGRGWI